MANDAELVDEVTDELDRPVTPVLDPLVATAPSELPIRKLHWEDFEKLVRDCAARVRGLLSVRCYGRRGQKQFGIDVYGSRRQDGEVEVLQARNVADVDADYLTKTVEAYINAGRRFDAATFVLCVASDCEDTSVDDALVSLRRKHKLGVELWDAATLSNELRSHPDLVERFFGLASRYAFCGGEPPATAGPVPTPTIDALLLGPIRALGLETRVEVAIQRDDPGSALEAASEIVQALATRGFDAFTARWRHEQATALRAMDRADEAFDIAFQLAVDTVATEVDVPVATLLDQLGDDVDPKRDHRRTGLLEYAKWLEGRGTLESLEEAARSLVDAGDEWAPQVALWWATAAGVDRNREHQSRVAQLADRVGPGTADKVRVQLQAWAADAGGGDRWDPLFAEAMMRRVPAAPASYLCARAGRWFAWQGRLDDAQRAYERAVELAADAHLPGDAGAYLRERAAVRAHAGLWGGPDDAAAARPLLNGDRYLDLPRQTRSDAMTAIADGRYPDAHDLLRRLLHEAIAGARLTQELEAHRRLGVLYLDSEEFPASAYHFALAGQPRDAGGAARRLDQPVAVKDLDPERASWHRAAVYSVIAEQGDLMPSTEANDLVPELIAASREPSPFFTPPVATYAFKALAGISLLLDESKARKAIEAFQPIADATGVTQVDDSYGDLLGAIYGSHSSLRHVVAPAIGSLLDDADRVPAALRGVRQAKSAPNELVEIVRARAAAGNEYAADVFVMLGIENDPSLVLIAQKRAARALATPLHRDSNSFSLASGFALGTAQLAALDEATLGAVVDHMLALAENDGDIANNRARAIAVLGAAASLLDAPRRSAVFTRVLTLAEAPALSAGDRLQVATQHMLSRFRINIRPDALPLQAVRSASYLALTGDERERVTATATALAPIGGREAEFALADVASVIGEPQFPAGVLSHSPSPFLRRAAAHVFVRGPIRDPQIGVNLAHDRDTTVRLELARRLGGMDNTALASLLATTLERDKSAQVRQAAKVLANAGAAAGEEPSPERADGT